MTHRRLCIGLQPAFCYEPPSSCIFQFLPCLTCVVRPFFSLSHCLSLSVFLFPFFFKIISGARRSQNNRTSSVAKRWTHHLQLSPSSPFGQTSMGLARHNATSNRWLLCRKEFSFNKKKKLITCFFAFRREQDLRSEIPTYA